MPYRSVLVLLFALVTLTNATYLHGVSPFKLRFAKNKFEFTLNAATLTDTVGRLELQPSEKTKNFLNLNELNVTVKATRDPSHANLFKINSRTLELQIKDQTSKQKLLSNNKYYLKVQLFDAYKRYLPTSCTVQISILDEKANNLAPRFTKNLYQAQIVENNAPNTLIVKVTAAEPQSRITYHFVNANSIQPFQIKSDTGEIYAKRVLNAEEKDFYNLTVMAINKEADSKPSSLVDVHVRVLSGSDKSPRFSRPAYNVTLSENSDVSSRPIVVQAQARDYDNGTSLVYSLAGSLNDMNTFEIEPQTGVVRLVSRLDYELKSNYSLSIVARDLGQPPRASYVPLNVLIEPSKPSPPIFSAPFYEFILYENAPIGQLVGGVHADVTNNKNASLVYSLSTSDNIPFRIEAHNGSIYTNSKIYKNLERYGYEFDVQAVVTVGQFRTESTIKIKIKILDINDFVPEFERSSYQLNVSEETNVGLPLLTLATTNDNINEKGVLTYSIELGNENNVFSLIKQGDTRAFLTLQRSNLNFKIRSSYDLLVKVMDQDGLYSTANIQARVIPADIYSPRFTNSTYKFKVYENSEVSTFVGQVQAQIPSGLNYEDLTYKIISVQDSSTSETADNSKDFSLNYKTGNLYVATDRLDRENYDSVTLYVTASVGKFVDHAIIQIYIRDVNDNPPVFTRPFYQINIYQDDIPNSYLIRLQATDQDQNKNSVITYSFKEPTTYLLIDQDSGVIRLNRSPPKNLNLTIIAQDSGQPSLISETFLLINLMPRMHLPPQFDRDTLEFYLVENMPVATVVGEVRARDPDLGLFANIVYKILENQELFELRPSGTYNSVLLVTKFISDLDTTSRGLIKVKIRAYSSFSSANVFTDITVRVHVQSLSESKPIVPNPVRIVFNNYKNYFLTPNSAFIPVYGVDESTNLTFSLLDSVGRQIVDLDPLSGRITFKPILNSNNLIDVSFLVGVEDGYHKIVTTCEMKVLMISDKLISESVTLSLANIDSNVFLDLLYTNFTNTLLDILPNSKMSNIHVFNLLNSSFGLNLSLSVSYNYDKDEFMSSTLLKQLLHAHTDLLQRKLHLSQIVIYEDASCGIEPCLNYQTCINNVKISLQNNEFLHANSVQFRPISVNHDFECRCPSGFTGRNSSVVCDLEINLCYSNPCGSNGVCLSIESGYKCLCNDGFTGSACQFNLAEMKCCADYKSNSTLCEHQSVSGILSSPPDGNQICKSPSRCKNLILGGIVCDKCADHYGPSTDKSFYNKFCELRAKHFPKGKNAFMALPGIHSRFRFNIRLTFATIKPSGYLFHNARLSLTARDFISLRINKGMLIFSYSMGSEQTSEIKIEDILVNDAKWRTVTVDYVNHKFILSLDNDNMPSVDSCSLVANRNTSQSDLIDCFRVESRYELPGKCSSQVETCFRYFDLNGPLVLGRQSNLDTKSDLSRQETALNYEGCISDLFVNERLVDLGSEAISDHQTEIGCGVKSNNNKVCGKRKAECERCEQIWGDQVRCDRVSDGLDIEADVVSLRGDGYLTLKEVEMSRHSGLKIEFYLKMSREEGFVSGRREVVAFFEVAGKGFYLDYDLRTNSLELIKTDEKKKLFSLAVDLDDGFWNRIRLEFVNGRLYLAVNDLLKASGEFNYPDEMLKGFLGGSPKVKAGGVAGCIKGVNQKLLLLRGSVNVVKGCHIDGQKRGISFSTNTCANACFNNATCIQSPKGDLTCQCQEPYLGQFCQHSSIISSTLLTTNANSSCPAKWWGNQPGICGPCSCDEANNFSPDCNQLNGTCHCKPKFYKRHNPLTGHTTCVPCSCNLEGSESLQCSPLTGQCPCLSGAGITGRRCDQCVSPFAEMTKTDTSVSCRQLSSSECPRSYAFNTWWPRTKFSEYATAECPKGSTGSAYRFCSQANGWSLKVDLTDCRSQNLIDLQLYKWSQLLTTNSSLLNAYQALQLADDLSRITALADSEDDLNYDATNFNFNTFLATSAASLYARDLIVIKDLLTHIIEFEISNAPSFLYIQDRNFLPALFNTLDRLLNKKYEPKLQQIRTYELITSRNSSEQQHQISPFEVISLISVLNKYLAVIVQSTGVNRNNNNINSNINIDLANLNLVVDNIVGQSYSPRSKLNQQVGFKLITADDTKDKQLAYVTLNSLASNLPEQLLMSNEKTGAVIGGKFHKDRFITVSSLLVLSIQQNKNVTESVYVVADFVLSNIIFPAVYNDAYKNLRIGPNSNYYCVFMGYNVDGESSWSTKGARLVDYNYETNTVKCSYDRAGVYAVVTSTSGLDNGNSQPIQFSLVSYVLMPVSFLVLLTTCVLLILIKRHSTPLIHIYLNLALTVLLIQIILFFGINANASQLLCKFLAIIQHYLHLTAYLWLLTLSLHLYRILVELRDINKQGTALPMFYYALCLGLPAIIVSLTLALKHSTYTNFNLFGNLYETNLAGSSNSFANFYLSSVYCFLCVTNYYETFYVLVLPLLVIIVATIIIAILSLNECQNTTFKKSQIPIVKHNLITLAVILPFQCVLTAFLLMLIYSATSSNLLSQFTIYQHLYLAACIMYSLQLLFVLFTFNKVNRNSLIKARHFFGNKTTVLNESLDTSKHNLYKRSPLGLKSGSAATTTADSSEAININDLGVEVLANINQQVFKPNSKYMLDYRNPSVSTTTSSGTLENTVDDCDFQANYLKHQYMLGAGGLNSSNGYMSHLANTTNTESDFYNSRFNIDFNNPPDQPVVRESDVIDVGKILKNHLNNVNSQFVDDSEEMMQPVDFRKKQFSNIHNEIVKCYDIPDTVQEALTLKKSQSLFWPNTVAECDTSYLEGSMIFTPNRHHNTNTQLTMPMKVMNEAEEVGRNFHKMSNFNSNSGSSTNSASYSTSTSSLVLNLNSLENGQQYQQNTSLPIKSCTTNAATNAVLILTHTGSPNSSDSESGNETRV